MQIVILVGSHKSELANELRKLQDKTSFFVNNVTIEKCINLTEELNQKKSDIRAFEKESKIRIDAISEM